MPCTVCAVHCVRCALCVPCTVCRALCRWRGTFFFVLAHTHRVTRIDWLSSLIKYDLTESVIFEQNTPLALILNLPANLHDEIYSEIILPFCDKRAKRMCHRFPTRHLIEKKLKNNCHQIFTVCLFFPYLIFTRSSEDTC